ncbi:unnamed protein product [Coccothraustes coccothraustes]
MQALRHTEDANLELCGAKRRSRAALRQELPFGEHCYRHNAQCAKKPLLRLREPQNAAAAESLAQEPRFGEHCYRHNAMCAKKQLLPLLEPQSAAVAET